MVQWLDVPKIGTLFALAENRLPMFEANSNQLNCLADLMLIAFLECLAPREASISLAQLHTRNFAPHQQATRDCICYLFKQGRVEISPFFQKWRGKVRVRDMTISLKLDSSFDNL